MMLLVGMTVGAALMAACWLATEVRRNLGEADELSYRRAKDSVEARKVARGHGPITREVVLFDGAGHPNWDGPDLSQGVRS